MAGIEVVTSRLSRSFAPSDDDQPICALDDVSIEIEPGEAVGIMGTSGCGKSTLLNLIGAMDAPTSGTVTVGGQDLSQMSARERAVFRRGLGFVFQQFHLLPGLGALENVMAPLAPRTKRSEAVRRSLHLLQEVGMDRRASALPGQLSGGQQQRVAIARALVGDPMLILADEPTGNLDRRTAEGVLDLLMAAQANRGATLILVTHDAGVAERCGRVIALRDGRLQEQPK